MAKEFEVNVEHQASIQSTLLLDTVLDFVTGGTKKGQLCEIMSVDDVVIIIDNMELNKKCELDKCTCR